MTTEQTGDLEPTPAIAARLKRHNTISERIKDWIVERALQPGDRLPGERELIDIFSASKSSVREALTALEVQGLIRLRTGPGGGAFVAAISDSRAMELLSNYFFFQKPGIGDIYALRIQLEPELAASVVGRLAEADFQRLERTMRLYIRPPANQGEEYAQRIAELDFHSVLADLCPNPLLGFVCGFLQNLLRNLTVCRRIYDQPQPRLREHAMHYQLQLLHALRDEDAEAARAIMREHMLAARAYMEQCEAQLREGFLRL